MYAVANVEKFIQDNPHLVGDQAENILKRAEEFSENGVFSGGMIGAIMGDEMLTQAFESAATSLEHIQIGLSAIAQRGPIA